MSHLPHPALLLQVGDPHPDLAQLQISLKHPPLPPVLITQCIGYKDVDYLLETDITLLFVIYTFSVQRLCTDRGGRWRCFRLSYTQYFFGIVR